jgi:hypothetical protein
VVEPWEHVVNRAYWDKLGGAWTICGGITEGVRLGRLQGAGVAEPELPLVIGAPQPVRLATVMQGGAFGLVAPAPAALHQAVAVEHGVNRRDSRRLGHRKRPQELVADLRRAPGRVFALDAENASLDLEG